MACCRQSRWAGAYVSVLFILFLASLRTSDCTNNDFYVDVVRETPSTMSENTLRHIMQLVSLGTGLSVPPPLNLRYREKTLKRARISAPRPRRPEFVIGSEFLGKRSTQKEDKRMGSEFLGKRMGSEFLGKRMGSEFLGKRMGSEFLGKRMGSEFLGKRMGSEFLGKRMGSEFLGKRTDTNGENEGDVSINTSGYELVEQGLNDASQDPKDENSEVERGNIRLKSSGRSTSSIYEQQKRIGSEFLGRKRREVKTTSRRISGA